MRYNRFSAYSYYRLPLAESQTGNAQKWLVASKTASQSRKGGNVTLLTETDILKKTIGQRLEMLREQRGLKRQGVSDELKGAISRSALEQLEKGLTEPRAQTLLLLSRYYNVSADFLLTGASPENLGAYRELGLTDETLAFWEKQIDIARNAEKFAAFSDVLNTLMTDTRFFNLFWGLIVLNAELDAVDKEIAAIESEMPAIDLSKTVRTQDVELLKKYSQTKGRVAPLQERRDFLQYRYQKEVEALFISYIKGDGE
jgi:transcriptional regulator with XRE-family HTH domain